MVVGGGRGVCVLGAAALQVFVLHAMCSMLTCPPCMPRCVRASVSYQHLPLLVRPPPRRPVPAGLACLAAAC